MVRDETRARTERRLEKKNMLELILDRFDNLEKSMFEQPASTFFMVQQLSNKVMMLESQVTFLQSQFQFGTFLSQNAVHSSQEPLVMQHLPTEPEPKLVESTHTPYVPSVDNILKSPTHGGSENDNSEGCITPVNIGNMLCDELAEMRSDMEAFISSQLANRVRDMEQKIMKDTIGPVVKHLGTVKEKEQEQHDEQQKKEDAQQEQKMQQKQPAEEQQREESDNEAWIARISSMEAALSMKGTGKGKGQEERLLQLEAALNVKGKGKGAPKEVRFLWLEAACKERERIGKNKRK